MMATKTKILNWLCQLQTYLSKTDERSRAMDVLGLNTADLAALKEFREQGRRAFALRELGLTKADLVNYEQLQAETKLPRVERILRLMGNPLDFRKFLLFAYTRYKGFNFKPKQQNRWKTLNEDELIHKIRSSQLKDDSDLFQTVLNAYFLYWKRHFSKEANAEKQS